MKILTAEQIRAIDAYTIAHEPVASLDLMERAASACVKRIVKLSEPDARFVIVCGKGNNGGDGLAIARLLLDLGYDSLACVVNYTNRFSEDAQHNYDRLSGKYNTRLHTINTGDELRELLAGADLIVDALLGTGVNKAAEGLLAEVIDIINASKIKVISIDVPSGLLTDSSSVNYKHIVHAWLVLSFQFPKLAFLLAENKDYAMEFELIDIGLSKTAIANAESHNYYVTKELVRSLLKPRNKFSHKGTYGHALLMAGSNGKSGAAIIAAKAALRSGAGLLTVHSTKETLTALLNHLPEAMSSEDAHPDRITEFDKPERYDAIGFGPGVGTAEETQQALKKLLNYYAGEIVIDADGLNILSENKTWLGFLPANCILTPHPKEFERLCGKQDGDFEQLETLRNFSLKYGCIVVLKCAHSAIAMPDGNIFFNSSGNAGLAKAGSGDGLTGVILGLLSRGYSAPQAAILGTFIHGYAADQCAKEKSMESILITDVIKELPKALKKLEKTD